MSLENEYRKLFESISTIVDAEPGRVPQLLAVILSGGPFRPFLEKPELLTKAIIMAKQYVASNKSSDVKRRPSRSDAGVAKPGASRQVTARDLIPPGPSKA